MLKEVFRFEINYRKTRPATYIYFGIIFLMCFLAVTTDAVQIGGAVGQVKENSPIVLTQMTLIVSVFMCLIASAVMGVAVLRDFEHNTEAIMFSTPLTKFSYLMGRFLGSFVVLVFIGCGIWIAFLFGDLMWWREKDKLLPINLWNYLQPFLVFCVPNLFFCGALLFMSGALSRRSIVLYTQGFLLLVLYIGSLSLLRDLDQKNIAAMIDPFGLRAFSYQTQYWTPAERNASVVPLADYVLYNRLLWTGIGVLALIVTYFGFSFNVVRNALVRRKAAPENFRTINPETVRLPRAQQILNFQTRISQFFRMTWFYATSILKEIPFIGIVICGLLMLLLNAINLDERYGTSSYPTTYTILDLINGSFGLFFVILVVFYSGELVWKERAVKIDLIIDALPIADFTTLIAKFLALFLIYTLLLLMLIFCGVLIQLSRGYTNFEWGVYFGSLFTSTMSFLLLYTFLSIFIQVMVNNKFIGYAFIVSFFILSLVFSQMGLEHALFQFGGAELGTYSDMNIYGHFVTPFAWFDVYWFGFSAFLFAVAVVFSVRGSESVIHMRWKAGRLRLNRTLVTFSISALTIFLFSGFYIFYNTNMINEYRNSDEVEKQQADYERTLKKYEFLPQPRIVEANVRVDVYPANRDFVAEGFYYLKNKTNAPIADIHIQQNYDNQITVDYNTFDRDTKVKQQLPEFRYTIYELATPLEPGDSLKMNFKISFTTNGFEEQGSNTDVIYNGTFFNNQYFPGIGYFEQAELSDDDDRKDNDLKEKERMLERDDPRGLAQSLFGDDADHIRFEMIIGTDPDQLAIAPGYLQRSWEENGRKYFHYKMDSPMCNFYSIISARYEVKRDTWNDVNLEIYYHPSHPYNLDKMMEGMKDALTYCTEHFGPFQFRQMRIMEFPRYATFAQSFANTVPFSEGIGFIARVKDPDEDIDYVYYVTAHEVAHQWWGHQAMEARVKGNAMLSESMSQYSAMMVMKKKFPPEILERYLKYELDNYLSGRAGERKKEQPLEFVEQQGYIHYRKASVIFFALQDYITEDSVNVAFRRYLDKWKFRDAPYPTSADLLQEIRRVTPDTLKYLITDMFETITLFENKTETAEYEEISENQFEVSLKVTSEKMRADSAGMETNIPVDDWIDIGIYGKDQEGKEKLIYLKKHKITTKENTFTILVHEKPLKGGIDPLHKLIDRHSNDNTKGMVRNVKLNPTIN